LNNLSPNESLKSQFSSGISCGNTTSYSKSLNYEKRKKEMLRVTLDNMNLRERIITMKSNYKKQDWRDHVRKHFDYLKNICEYPVLIEEELDYDPEELAKMEKSNSIMCQKNFRLNRENSTKNNSKLDNNPLSQDATYSNLNAQTYTQHYKKDSYRKNNYMKSGPNFTKKENPRNNTDSNILDKSNKIPNIQNVDKKPPKNKAVFFNKEIVYKGKKFMCTMKNDSQNQISVDILQ